MIKTALLLTLLLTASSASAKPAEIYGNANGMWSPTHPHLTSNRTGPPEHAASHDNSPADHSAAYDNSHIHERPVEMEEVADITECPTFSSAPHRCEALGFPIETASTDP